MPGIASPCGFSVVRPTNMLPMILFSHEPLALCGSSVSGSLELAMSSVFLSLSKPMTGALAHPPRAAAPPAPASKALRLVHVAIASSPRPAPKPADKSPRQTRMNPPATGGEYMRFVLASLCIAVLTAGAASAQQPPATPGVLDQVYACADITDETQRLACYDHAVGRLREAQTTGNLVAVDRAQAEDIDRDSFGFTLPSLGRLFGGHGGENASASGGAGATPPTPAARPPAIARVDAMQLEIARVVMRRDGTASFTMTNGQVWSQIDDESPRNARAGGHVTIRRASLGSYLMSVEAGGPALRVRRTQ